MKYKQSKTDKTPSMYTLFYYKVQLHVSAALYSHHQAKFKTDKKEGT